MIAEYFNVRKLSKYSAEIGRVHILWNKCILFIVIFSGNPYIHRIFKCSNLNSNHWNILEVINGLFNSTHRNNKYNTQGAATCKYSPTIFFQCGTHYN
jgi:hypothetical protein